VRLFETPELFTRGLMDFAGLSEDTATRFAQMFRGAAITDQKLIMVKIRPDRHRLSSQLIVTDELMHLLQHTWGGSVRNIPSWKANGQAFVYAVQHVEQLAGAHAAGFYRRRAITGVKERWADLSGLSIISLTTSRHWVDAVAQLSAPGIYGYAFLAYEYLAQQTSFEAVLDYFSRLRDGTPEREAFLAAFGFPAEEFDINARTHIATLIATGLPPLHQHTHHASAHARHPATPAITTLHAKDAAP
jgi:hypothetical protein